MIELLAPAGELNTFKAVIDAGADAVYFGGDMFSARAYAKNFTKEEAKEAIIYAHFYGKKAYMTVNTLLKNVELNEEFYNYISYYVSAGLDGFIIQDLGVFNFIKRHFPSAELHASTQMTISSPYGAKLLESMGAKRIVTGRELSLTEIAAIRKECPDLEIESFCHGALCVCYSGSCLMSSFMGGRSGNRGRCAGPCRLPYEVLDSNKKQIKASEYPLSPKDFCLINRIPEMIEAGVNSFKIEGRMKQTSYAAGVVSIYRKYLDAYISGNWNGVSREDMNLLLDLGSRDGFTELYLDKHNGKELMTAGDSSHRRSEESAVLPERKNFPLDITVKAKIGEPLSITMNDNGTSHNACGPVVEIASKVPTTKEDVLKHISKLGDTGFKVGAIHIDISENAFVPASIINNLRRECVAALFDKRIEISRQVINEYTPLINRSKRKDSDIENLYVSVENEEQLDTVLEYDFVNQLILPVSLWNKLYSNKTKKEKLETIRSKVILKIYPVIRRDYLESAFDFDGRYLVSNVDGIGYLKDCNVSMDRVIADFRMYSFNDEAIKCLAELGINVFMSPLELSSAEISHMNSENKVMLIYGRIPLMYTANCVNKNTFGCDKTNKTLYLKDRKGEILPVKCDCSQCTNVIYNCKKHNLLSELNLAIMSMGLSGVRIDFTLEGSSEVKAVMDSYKNALSGNTFNLKSDETKGHFKKGVM